MIVSSCKKDEEEDDNSDSKITIDSDWQVKYTLDGVTYNYKEGDWGTDFISGSYSRDESWVPAPDTSSVSWGSGLFSWDGVSFIDIDRGTLKYVGSFPDEDQFKSFFAPGNYPFAPDGGNGMWLRWYDDNGDMWTTYYGSGDQSGSSIKIDEIAEETGIQGYAIKVKLSFNCKVYDENGNSKTLTNGIYVGKFLHY